MRCHVSWPWAVVPQCLNKRGQVPPPSVGGWTHNLPLTPWVGRVRPVICPRGGGEVDTRSKHHPDPRAVGGLRVSGGLHSSRHLPPACHAPSNSLQVFHQRPATHHGHSPCLDGQPPNHLSSHPPPSPWPLSGPPLLLTSVPASNPLPTFLPPATTAPRCPQEKPVLQASS